MATITTNYELTKAGYNDVPDIETINDNMDTLDSSLVVGESNDDVMETITKTTGWTNADPVTLGDKFQSAMTKISTMIKNLKWIYKFIGSTDISSIGDGTITNAISTLSSDKLNASDVKTSLTDTSTSHALSTASGKALNDALGTKAAQSALDSTNTTVSTMNIKSVTRVATQVITGGTGNISTGLTNDGWTYVLTPFLSTSSNWRAYAWVASTGSWYIKVVDADTGNPIANTSVALRYLVLKIVTP